ncbi:PP2C family protein-serine/threonine phosphatase [Thiomicrospira microaerophila]|uniref:PP2C family protein-serine/threonine phosphatase n=1 Tax=Thiomicrospira microaerophila TaxID=406020 RepID=UPI000698BCFF|nr:protein phosphatase 2C domain-containing protein [Thiomicrospira microaerophila]
MKTKIKLVYGSSIHQGARAYQEDSCYWLETAKSGCMGFVLADGMGGHAAGDVASQTLVKNYQAVFSQLAQIDSITDALATSLHKANQEIKTLIREQPALASMGSTYLAGFVCDKTLYWISVGDSPLYLYSGGKLRQINEDHSMAPELKERVAKGEITQEQADTHPNRNSLYSAVMGDAIEMIDHPKKGIALDVGDVVIIASDGIQTLSEQEIETIVKHWHEHTADADLTNILLEAVLKKKNPRQDNTTIMAAAFISSSTTSNQNIEADANANDMSWSSLMREDTSPKKTSSANPRKSMWALGLLALLALGVFSTMSLMKEDTSAEEHPLATHEELQLGIEVETSGLNQPQTLDGQVPLLPDANDASINKEEGSPGEL